MISIELTRQQMKEELAGYQFLYKSPTTGGETVGTVTDIGVDHRAAFDRQTEALVGYRLSKISPKVEDQEKPETPTEPYIRWVGYKFKFYIISDTGNRYELDEVYILKEYEESYLAGRHKESE